MINKKVDPYVHFESFSFNFRRASEFQAGNNIRLLHSKKQYSFKHSKEKYSNVEVVNL